MSLVTLLFISIGLAMDAFAVSVAQGFILKEKKLAHAFKLGISFGLFQMVMPIIGWRMGIGVQRYIAMIDHWIAFGLLAAIGCKMIFEAFEIEEIEGKAESVSFAALLFLSIATSIDALAVGLSFACLNISIIVPALVIGVITFVMSCFGVLLGDRIGHVFENKIEIAGGIILISIGFKILIEHLF